MILRLRDFAASRRPVVRVMDEEKKTKIVKVHNKSSKPDNVVKKEHDIVAECTALERELPGFLRGYFSYLRGNVLPMTRRAYLFDVRFFCHYLITERPDITPAKAAMDIKLSDFALIQAVDINMFIDFCRHYEKEGEKAIYVYENGNKTLARKKSSVSVLFKQLYRDGLLEKNITDGFDPIRVPKPGEREIKALQDNEVMLMLDAVSTGVGLTGKEHDYWEKTKKRDKAILMLFITYGLRISELQQLNISSFNFNRGEFKIYRKRDKESVMPLNDSVTEVVLDYINNERPKDDQIVEEHQDALFISLQGKRMTERSIRELSKKYTSIGMQVSRNAGYSPHKLRATAATSLIGRGNSIFDVQQLLDHEQVTTTQLYAAHKMNTNRDLVRGMEWEKERKEGQSSDDDDK